MRSIDKNDVDISKLFRWGAKFNILDSRDQVIVEVYIRLVGDAELNRARVFALRKSAELRSKLREENSDERLAFIPPLEDLDKENLVETALLYMIRDITLDAIKDTRLPLPAEPDSDSSLEKQEKYQKEVDEYPTKKDSIIREKIEKTVELRRQELLSNYRICI